jgi:hypothetical protein
MSRSRKEAGLSIGTPVLLRFRHLMRVPQRVPQTGRLLGKMDSGKASSGGSRPRRQGGSAPDCRGRCLEKPIQHGPTHGAYTDRYDCVWSPFAMTLYADCVPGGNC